MNEEVARRLGAAPSPLGFGGPAARLALDAMYFPLLHSAFLIQKMVRLPGVAPGHAPWREAILLLNHNREIKRAGSVIAPPARAISTKNKHLLAVYLTPARGFTAAVSVFEGTPPDKALKM